MKHRIEVTSKAMKQLLKLDKPVFQLITKYFDGLADLDDPRTRGKELTGNLIGLWQYRVGDYRILCKILDEALIILVIDIGHRKEVYR
jgi:mRNA interferase RelE/StbE